MNSNENSLNFEKTVRQHYLPRFILKNFTNNAKQQVSAYSFKDKKFFTPNIKEISVENRFYNFQYASNINSNSIEEELSKVESKIAKVIDKVVSNPTTCKFGVYDVHMLYRYQILQLIRIPHAKNFSNSIFKQITDTNIPPPISNNPQFISAEMNKIFNDHYLDLVLNILKLNNPDLSRQGYHIDILYDSRKRFVINNNGFAMSGVREVFPISPDILLVFLDQADPTMQEIIVPSRTPTAHPQIFFCEADENTINWYNKLQIYPPFMQINFAYAYDKNTLEQCITNQCRSSTL